MCFDFLYNFCLKRFLTQEEFSVLSSYIEAGETLYVSAVSIRFFPDLNFSTPQKSPSIKFHENPSSRIRVVPYARTHKHYQAKGRFSQIRERA